MQYIGIVLELLLFTLIVIFFIYMYNKQKHRFVTGNILLPENNINTTYEFGNYFENYRHGICIELPSSLPSLYVDTHDGAVFARSTSNTYANATQLSLEGSFNNYFQIFCVKDNEREILEILSPDVMQILMDTLHNYDLEISQNKLWLISLDPLPLPLAPNNDLLEATAKIGDLFYAIAKSKTFMNNTTFNYQSSPMVKIGSYYIPRGIFIFGVFSFVVASISFVASIFGVIGFGAPALPMLLLVFAIFPGAPYILYKYQQRSANIGIKTSNENFSNITTALKLLFRKKK